MINLLNQKLEAILNLKQYTKEIISLSSKIDDEKINSLIDGRVEYFEKINEINDEISLKVKEDNYFETEEMKIINEKIKAELNEIILLDNKLRKNINAEIKNIKDKLNQPKTNSKLINIKI